MASMDDVFKGEGETVQTDKDRERGPECFRAMTTGQVAKVIFLGWLAGQKYGEQPIVFSPLKGYAFALPAHTILIDKLKEVAPFTPLSLTCERAAEKGSSKPARYNVVSYAVVTDGALLKTFKAAKADLERRVNVLRGSATAAAAAADDETDDLPF